MYESNDHGATVTTDAQSSEKTSVCFSLIAKCGKECDKNCTYSTSWLSDENTSDVLINFKNDGRFVGNEISLTICHNSSEKKGKSIIYGESCCFFEETISKDLLEDNVQFKQLISEIEDSAKERCKKCGTFLVGSDSKALQSEELMHS